MTTRVLSPATARSPFTLPSGQAVAQTPGTFVDVTDAQAALLVANGWVRAGTVGSTKERPSSSPLVGATVAQAGSQHFDLDLGKLIIHDGTAWRDPATGAVV